MPPPSEPAEFPETVHLLDPGGPVLRFCFAKKEETLLAAAQRLRKLRPA